MKNKYMLLSVIDKADRVGTAVRVDPKAPPAVVLHCWSNGDPSVGIPSYEETFIVQPQHGEIPTGLALALRETIVEWVEWVDCVATAIVCPGPQACPVCNPACDECGGRNGKHLRGCSVKHYRTKGKARP